MKKKVIAVLLAVILATTAVVPTAAAEELSLSHVDIDEIESAMQVISNAVGDMDEVFTAPESVDIISIFTGFVDAFKGVGSMLGPINGTVTFLKLVGIIKDKNAESLADILIQLSAITDQLSDMDRKLDDLTVEISKLEATEEFNARANKAAILQTSWKSFEYRYMEKGMDSMMSEFNGMMLDGMQNWCMASGPSARTVNGVNNSEIILFYVPSGDGYTLEYTAANGIPADISANTRYLVLGSDILPGQITWNVNTYRSAIKSAIVGNLKSKLALGDGYTFEEANFPAFAPGGADEATDELLDTVAEDAVNALAYRVSSAELNKSSKFSLDVLQEFSNYCTHLLSSGEGLDSIFKTMYLTHAFEYEIADDYSAFCNQMAVKTGVYGSFTLNVLGMSNYIQDGEKLAALDTYCRTVNAIGDCRDSGLTGNGNYCYLTNSLLEFGEMSFTTKADVVTTKRGYVQGYRSCSAKPVATEINYGKARYSADSSALLGESKMMLVQYMLQSNGIKLGFDYLNDRLGEGAATDYGSTVICINSEQPMPLNSSTPLTATKLIGSYFSSGKTVRLSSLPDDAESEYINFHRMVTGSLMDTGTGSIAVSQVLSALAIYGESYWLWETDEAAFLGGPNNHKSFTYSCSKEATDIEFPNKDIFTHHYSQCLKYNCIIEKAADTALKSISGPLGSYISLSNELHKEYGEESPLPDNSNENGSDTGGENAVVPSGQSETENGPDTSGMDGNKKSPISDTVPAGSGQDNKKETKPADNEKSNAKDSDTGSLVPQGAPETDTDSDTDTGNSPAADTTPSGRGNGVIWTVAAAAVVCAGAVTFLVLKSKSRKR